MKINNWKIKKIAKLEIIAITQGYIEVLRIAYVNLRQSVPKRIYIVSHNGYHYDYNFHCTKNEVFH